jgi:hypothetical protein
MALYSEVSALLVTSYYVVIGDLGRGPVLYVRKRRFQM